MLGVTGSPHVVTPPAAYVSTLVETALSEDLGGDPGQDVTTAATVAAGRRARVTVRTRAEGVVAGQIVWPVVCAATARRLGVPCPQANLTVSDGERVPAGTALAVMSGPAHVLLAAERSGLNLAGRAAGIATATRAWVDALAGTGVTVLDTRKTPPGLRRWDKYAVTCGGGVNKRMGLFDTVMIKDNHVAAAGGVDAAVRAARERAPGLPLEVEVEDLQQAEEALRAGARYLMLDNMAVADMAVAVRAARALVAELDGPEGRVHIEATGGMTLGTVDAVAATGVDHVSVGALTHSAPVLDIGLDWDR